MALCGEGKTISVHIYTVPAKKVQGHWNPRLPQDRTQKSLFANWFCMHVLPVTKTGYEGRLGATQGPHRESHTRSTAHEQTGRMHPGCQRWEKLWGIGGGQRKLPRGRCQQ